MSAKIERTQIIAFTVAFLIGAAFFTYGMDVISPASDLKLECVGLDTVLGMTDESMKGDLASVTSWWKHNIWVDPDRKGDTTFTLRFTGSVLAGLLPFTVKGTATQEVSRTVTGYPDIVLTLTEPIPIVEPNPIEIDFRGLHYELHKTTWEVIIKTQADSKADTLFAEIAHEEHTDLGLLGINIDITPPIGRVWEGNAYVKYTVQNIKGAFIYEAYVNRDPKVGLTTDLPSKPIGFRGLNIIDAEAGAIPAIAYAIQESKSVVGFYDRVGGELLDFKGAATNEGVIALGAQLGVGGDPIIEKHTWPVPDKFKGWNIYNTYVQYQVATIIAVPVVVDEKGDSTGDIIDPDTGLPTGKTTEQFTGSQREEDIGLPAEYRTEIKDTESALANLFETLTPAIGGFTDKLLILVIGFLAVVAIVIILKLLLWLFPRRQRFY